MTTYQEQFQKAVAGETIPPYWLGYFREEHREALNEQLIELLRAAGLSQVTLAKKIGRRPEQVTRWINSPSNLEADTISDLALAFGYRPRVNWEPIAFKATQAKGSAASPASRVVASDGNVVEVDFAPADSSYLRGSATSIRATSSSTSAQMVAQ